MDTNEQMKRRAEQAADYAKQLARDADGDVAAIVVTVLYEDQATHDVGVGIGSALRHGLLTSSFVAPLSDSWGGYLSKIHGANVCDDADCSYCARKVAGSRN